MNSILYNGKIRISKGQFVEAVVIKEGKILDIGSNELEKNLPKCYKRIDLNGRLVLPGFNDSHMHLLNVGYNYQQINLRNCISIDDVKKLILEEIDVRDAEDYRWIQCYGWNEDNWIEKRKITRFDLDELSLDIPILASRVCLHTCTVNTKALDLLGLDKEKYQDGILYEMFPIIFEKLPEYQVADIKKMIMSASKAAAKVGITTVQTDDLCSLPGNCKDKIIEAYKELAESGELPIRVYEQCRITNENEYNDFIESGYKSGLGNETFKLGPLKTFCDGSLGSRTAWLKEPYDDDSDNIGIRIYDDEQELKNLIAKAHKDNMASAIHCIGDAAAEQAISAIEYAIEKNPDIQLRHGIVHAQILSDDMIDRLREKNINAYIQPVFLEYDLHMAEKRLGATRIEDGYNFRKMYDKGIKIALGTDSPVEDFNPMLNIYCAVTGKDFDGNPTEGWHTEKLLTVDECITCYSEHSAYTCNSESLIGKIHPGYFADLVVMDNDIFEIEKECIKDACVYMTIMGGNITYKSNL